MVALQRDFREAVVQVGQNGLWFVVCGGQKHGLHLQLEGAGIIVSIDNSSLGSFMFTSRFCDRTSGQAISSTRRSWSLGCLYRN